MNKSELALRRRKIYRAYHIPGQSHLHPRKINAVFLSSANSWEHEQAKCKVCYDLLKEKKRFITEAVDNKTGERGDVVVLDTGERIEIECDKHRAKRFEGRDVTVIKLWDESDSSPVQVRGSSRTNNYKITKVGAGDMSVEYEAARNKKNIKKR